jgi:NADPH:quinone reductase
MKPPPGMQAAVCHRLSEDLSGVGMAGAAVPLPGPGEVLVQVAAAGINYPDVLMCQGRYQFRPEPPFVPGMELSGHVVGRGEGVSGLRDGDAVMGAARLGAMAGYAVLPASAIQPVPPGLSMQQAAGFQTAYLTAWVGLVRRACLQAGEVLLVHGAAGGVGLAAVDLGLALGATVIAAGSTPEKRALLEARGAHAVIDPALGFRETVRALTGGRGADVIYDPVGGDVFDESTRCIAFDGRLLVIGFAGGRIATLSTNMALIKGFSVLGVRAGEYGRQFPDRALADREALSRMAGEGRLRPHVGAVLPLEDVRAGLRLLAERKVLGKAVLLP